MGVECECSSTALMCPEDKSSVLGIDDEKTGIWEKSLDNEIVGFPLLSDECMALLVSKESNHMPKEDYVVGLQNDGLNLSIRREAIDWIGKAQAQYNLGPLTTYLAVNYLDRFLSFSEALQGKVWMTELLSVTCLSLAAKMEETDVPMTFNLQVVNSKFVFEAKTIERMELLVLATLKWRMLAVTPFSFIDGFLHIFNGGESPPNLYFSKSMELILSTINRVEFLSFRPSEVAAAVALHVLSAQIKNMHYDNVFSSCNYIKRDTVFKCYELIRTMKSMCSGSESSFPQSPSGVLNTTCLSSSSNLVIASQEHSHQTLPEAKRRKINSFAS